MKKLKFKIIDRHTIELDENGSIGDRVDLNDKIDLDLSVMADSIQEEFNRKIKEQRAEDAKVFQNRFNSMKTELENNLRLQNQNTFVAKENEYQAKLNQLDNSYQVRINQLNANHQNQIHDLNNQMIDLKSEFNVKLNEKQKEIDDLLRKHDDKTIKNIGEDLEKWCFNEFAKVQSYGGFTNCVLEKDNTLRSNEVDPNSTKADFIFHVYALDDPTMKNELVSVCCEMKSLAYGAKTTRKFYEPSELKKLDADRTKKNCQEALMITEREMENNILFETVKEYPNMYIIRPSIFLAVLNVYANMYQKYATEINKVRHDKSAYEEEFASKKQITDRFNKLKESVFIDLSRISKYLHTNNDEAEKIVKSANRIKENNEGVITNSLAKIQSKIEKFSFGKLDDFDYPTDEN